MKKATKYLLVFFLFFIMSLPISYLMVYYVKQKMLEHEIEESMTYLEKEMSSTEKEFEKMFNEIDKSHDLDINSGGQMREYAQRKIYFTSYYYALEYERFVTSLPEKSLHYAILDYYGKQGLRVKLLFITIIPYNYAWEQFSFDNRDNYINRLYDYVKEWKKESGNESKDWWNDFEKSEFFEEFLNDIFLEIEHSNDLTIDEAYEKMMNVDEQSENKLVDFEMRNYLIPFYKRIAVTAYNRYYEDKKKGDYFAAIVDSKMMYEIWKNYHGLKKEDIYSTLIFLQNLKISNIYLDLILIVDLAVIMALVLLIVYEKWEKRQASTARFI